MWSAVEELVNRRFILQYKKDNGDLYFTVPNEVVAAMREDRIYSPSANADLTIDQWMSALSKLLNAKDNDNIPFANFVEDNYLPLCGLFSQGYSLVGEFPNYLNM